MYILLSGKPPFDGPDDLAILKSVERATYSMSGDVWQSISLSGRDLVKKLLEPNVDLRITAVQALGHDWILKHKSNTLDIAE